MRLPIKGKISPEIKYIFSLFFVTRIVLTIIGVSSRILLEPFHRYPVTWIYSKHLWLDIWGVWDTGWYLKIARNWYPMLNPLPMRSSNWGFFPFYPLLMRLLGGGIGDLYLAGIIISNICLILSCVFLYRMVRLNSDNNTALRSVKYLFLFPTAFVLSGVFSESLFLVLIILCFYHAKKGNWFLAGISGFFLSLTRPLGIFVVLPLLYEYFRARNFRLLDTDRGVLFLSLIPLGLFTFAIYSYYLTGDFLAHVHAKQAGWMVFLSNPFKVLYYTLFTDIITPFGGRIDLVFNAIFVIATILLLSLFYKKIRFSYWLTGMILCAVPLMGGINVMTGMGRFTLVIFPLYIIFAKLGKNRHLDQIITISLALFQGLLMVFWSNGFYLIV